jgi:hypothetical protein
MQDDARGKPTYVRVYADAAGDTHFEDVHLPTERYSSPTGTQEARTIAFPAGGLVFRTVLVEASDTKPHNAPQRLLIVQLDGTVEVEVSDGEMRRFGPGIILVVEDLVGKGHVTRTVSNEPRTTLIAPLLTPC